MTFVSDKNRVLIFDTTLRDGEQSPGATMSHNEKLEIASLLDEMGVDIIEAGFPIASQGDFEAVSEIAKNSKNSVICGLARASITDIDRCMEAVKHAAQPRIHTFIGTSPLHRDITALSMDEMADKIHDTVTHARNLCDNVQWSPMDAIRTEHDYLCRVVEIAIKAGATTINIPDTVGYTIPRESSAIIKMLLDRVPGADNIIFATHCHNDLGMATANSLAAVEAGARQIECTINGLGERAGNTALEEVVMALKVRNDIMPYSTKIDTTKIMNISRRVSQVSGFVVQPNKAIVGKNAFAHESGIHQDGMLKKAETFELMRPAAGSEGQNEHIKIKHLRVVCGSEAPQTADITLEIDGVEKQCTSEGDGPVDATFKAIKTLYPTQARLQIYQVNAVTEGTDAQATVSVRLEEDGRIATGQSSDTDTVFASAKAYVNAVNRLIVRRTKSAPGADTKEVKYTDAG